MNPEMDEARILAQLERRLSRDDPALAATMDALNQQFPDEPPAESAAGRKVTEKRRDWWWIAAKVFAVLALLGLVLTAVLTRNPHQDDKVPPRGIAPVVSLQAGRRSPGTQRRCRWRGAVRVGS